MNTSWGTIFAYAGIFIVGLAGGGFLCLPLLAAALAPALHGPALVTGLAGALLISIAAAAVAWQLGLRRLPRVGEP